MSDSHYSGRDLRHAALYSFCREGNISSYYTTVEENELIDFTDLFGVHTHANFLRIDSIDNDLYFSPNDNGHYIYVGSGNIETIEYYDLTKIRLHCPIGTKLRWYIQTF